MQVVTTVADAHGCNATIQWTAIPYIPVVNTPAMVSLVERVAGRFGDKGRWLRMEEPLMVGVDFGFMSGSSGLRPSHRHTRKDGLVPTLCPGMRWGGGVIEWMKGQAVACSQRIDRGWRLESRAQVLYLGLRLTLSSGDAPQRAPVTHCPVGKQPCSGVYTRTQNCTA